MVYCGKPSKACSHCRARQAKCDRKLECGQCRRAGLKCPGPRDPNELVFRDQSQEVSRKAASRGSKSTNLSFISPTVLEHAKSIFFARYVDGNSRTYDYISPLFSKARGKTCLPCAIDAVSLAYFSSQNYSEDILRKAREKYVLALRLVGSAVESHDLAVQDTTLVSVLLLDLFEKLTRTYRSSESWTKHMNGAIEIVKLRGESQFENALGLRLFMQLNSTILIGCMQHDVRVPTDLINLWCEASKYVDIIGPKWKFSEIVVRLVDFRAAMIEGRLSTEDFLRTAKHLDAELKTVSGNVPLEWKYETISLQSSLNGVYGDHFHVYADHHMTLTWNNIRIIRILLNDLIREYYLDQLGSKEQSPFTSNKFPSRITEVSENIVSLSTDILASVPQYTQLPRHINKTSPILPSLDTFGETLCKSKETLLSGSPKPRSSSSDPTKSDQRAFTPFEISRCFSLIFPLYVVGSSEVCPDSMQEWVLDTLNSIADVVGIKEAGVTVGYLKRKEKINPWSLYAIIGSYSFSA